MSIPIAVIVPWHNQDQVHAFWAAWGLNENEPRPEWLIFQQDKDREGCAKTKNKGILRALEANAEVICILDDDCYPVGNWTERSLELWAEAHVAALQPQPVELFTVITAPPSRGTPYMASNRCIQRPVAASMGFWEGVPDLDAPSQLQRDNGQIKRIMEFRPQVLYHRYCAFSGMNCAFRAEFWPHFKFDETAERYDDIWGLLRLQAEAYRRGYCVNLNGPPVRHSRQSNVWHNLRVESLNIERNETLWREYVV